MQNTDVLPKRKSIRLNGYDYSSCGAYFVTLCTKDKKKLFWNSVGANCVRPNEPPLSEIGKIVDYEINKISTIYNAVVIDKYVVMPNHIHMIIMILADEYGRPQVAPTVSRLVKQFKGSISKQVGFPVWQRSYHDHIIRNQSDYDEIWQYIDENPLKWQLDCYY
ncbi:MAG: transposase [Acutalibacteraceae bacterium]